MQYPRLVFITLPNIFTRCREDEFGGSVFPLPFLLQPCPRSSAYSKTLFPSGSIFLDSAAKICRHQHCTYYCIKYSLYSRLQYFIGDTTARSRVEHYGFRRFPCVKQYPSSWFRYISYVLYTQKRLGMEQFHSGGANAGNGLKFPQFIRKYMTYILPWIVVIIYLKGYYDKFSSQSNVVFGVWMAVAFAFLLLVFPSHGSKNRPNYNRFYKFALLSADSEYYQKKVLWISKELSFFTVANYI